MLVRSDHCLLTQRKPGFWNAVIGVAFFHARRARTPVDFGVGVGASSGLLVHGFHIERICFEVLKFLWEIVALLGSFV
jgi:hypothetical protein